MKLLPVDDSIFIFLSYGILVIHIGSGMAAQQEFFVKHVKTVFVQVHNAVQMHEMLLCCDGSRKCHHAAQTPTWTFDMFYKIDCCAAIIGRIWMNNVPNESRIIMLSCTEISFVVSFFDFEKFGVKPGFPFFNSHCRICSLCVLLLWLILKIIFKSTHPITKEKKRKLQSFVLQLW